MRSAAWLLLLVALAAIAWFVFGGDPATETTTPETTTPESVDEGTESEGSATLEGRAPDPLTSGDPSARVGWTIPGRVIDVRGEPVAGVRVVVRRRGPDRGHGGNASRLLDYTWRNAPAGLAVIEETVSDADGRFGVTSPADTSWWLTVEAHPAPPSVGTSAQIAGLRHGARAIVLVVAEGHALEGRVVDAAGKGVSAGIELSMWSSRQWAGSGSRYSVRGLSTDADGNFSVPAVPAGRVQLTVVVPGRIVRMFGVSVPHTGDLVLRLFDANGARVVGIVTDKTKAPIAGAHMALRLAAKGSGVHAMAETDGAGAYACAGLPPGALSEVVFEAKGYRIARFEAGNRPLKTGETLTVDMTLERGASVAGTVRTSEGAPVKGASVSVSVSEPTHYAHYIAETDASGAYRVDGLLPGKWAGVRVDAEGLYQPEQKEGAVSNREPTRLRVKLPAEGETAKADVILLPAIPLKGRVVDLAGVPVAGAEVRLRVDESMPQERHDYVQTPPMVPVAHSDGDAAFRFAGLPPGTRWHAQAFKGLGRSQPSVAFEIPEKGEAKSIELVIGSAATLEGVVSVPDGTPAVGLRVYVKGATERRTQTDAGGRFVVAGLSAGEHEVKVGPSRSDPVTKPVKIVLSAGEHKTLELTTRAALITTGKILDADGEPLANETALIQPASTSGFYGELLFTDERGHFETRHWQPSSYRILVGSRRAGDEFDAGAQGLVLRVQPAGRDRVTIRIVGPDGEPVPECDLEVMTGTASSKSGNTRKVHGGIHVLRTHELETHTDLIVSNARDADGKPMNVRPAQLHAVDMDRDEIVIRLEVGRTLTGTVVGPRDEPVEGVRVMLAGARVVMGASGGQRVLEGAVTDAEGRFLIRGLPARIILDVVPKAPYIAPEQVEVPAAQDSVRISLARGTTLVVTVVGPDGKPVLDAAVHVTPTRYTRPWSRSGKTNTDGVFEADGLDPKDAINIRVDPGEELPKTERRNLPLGDGQIRIQLAAPVWVEGTVIDTAGKPVKAAHVSVDGMIEPRAFAVHRSASTDAEAGRFRIGPLAAGAYWMSVRPPAGSGLASSGQVRVVVPNANANFVLPRSASLSGRLLVDDIKGWSVSWSSGRQGFAANLSKGGRFRLENVPELLGRLWARGPKGQYALLEDILPTAGPFTLRPREGGQIRGRVEGMVADAMHYHLWALRGSVYVGGLIQQDGTFVIEGVPPGPWRLVLQYKLAEVAALDEVEAGGDPVVLKANSGQR